MTISRICIDCVLTDPFGKTASRIMDYLLSDKPFDEQTCRELIHDSVKAGSDAVMESIRGFDILSEQRFKLLHSKNHMDFIDRSISELHTKSFRISCTYDPLVKRIATQPELFL
jgi:hypothetical protein